MSNVFTYCRAAVTSDLFSTSQLRMMAAAKGFAVDPDDVVVEVGLASVPVDARPGWRRLLERLYEGDVLVVPELDSLGRDVTEVRATITLLAKTGVRVHCLVLGRLNLAGLEGKSAMDMLAAVASLDLGRNFELARMLDHAGKAETTAARGRPRILNKEQVVEAHELLTQGVSVVQIAQRLKTSRQTIMRLRARGVSDAIIRA